MKSTASMLLLLLISSACGGDDEPADTGSPDTSVVDSATDSAPMDTGVRDSSEDTGAMDTSVGDATMDATDDVGPDATMDAMLDGSGDAGFVCTANMLTNGTFDTDVSDWDVTFPTINTVDHDPAVDASGSSSSGSLRSRSTRALTQRDPVGQCVTVAAGTTVAVHARAMIATSATEDGEVQLSLNFYGMADCGGAFLTTQSSPRQSTEGDWLTLDVSGTAPASTVSMRVMLDVIRTSGTELTTHWDDVCAVGS
jgi:hypothetical protein